MKKINILVVDDRPEGILSVEAVLTSPEYNLVKAGSGKEALKYLLQEEFAVILLDVQMPEMNGFETASIIKTREKSKDVPIIFMSAINQDEHYVYQGYDVGAVDYLLKPFDPYILRSKVAIFVDIYRKKKLISEQSQRLRESEAKEHAIEIDRIEIENLKRYRTLADSIPEIVFRVNKNGHYEYFNNVWFDYTGLNETKCKELKWVEVFHPDDKKVLEAIFSGKDTRSRFECECRIMNKKGEFRFHLIKIQAEKTSESGEVISWLGTAIDIEERKKNEEIQKFLSEAGEVLVSTLDFGHALNQISKLAVPKLGDWVVFDVLDENDNLETISVHHRDQKQVDYAKKIHADKLGQAATEVLATGNKQVLDNHELGEMSAMILPLCFHQRPIGAMSIVRETGGKKADEKTIHLAEELSRRISFALENFRLYKLSQDAIEVRNDFLSIASHELNTPITSLKLQLQMLKKTLLMTKDGSFPLEKFTKSLDTSVKQVDRLINLIQILLDVSRIQSGKFTFHFEEINARDVITEVVEYHRQIIQNSESTLEVMNIKDIKVVWDKTRMEQVITNLVTNAIKYAPGKIELSMSEKDDTVVISIKDYGKGIAPAKLKTIFDRFERATSNESISGLGLGLYIVKQIAEGHHGKVEVFSEENKGTEFILYLPKNASLSADQFEEKHLH